MAALLSPPADTPLPHLIDLAWHASFDLLEAIRAGDLHAAVIPAAWLAATREHPRATPALKRMAGHTLEISLKAFGGTAPAFDPVQPSDGEAC